MKKRLLAFAAIFCLMTSFASFAEGEQATGDAVPSMQNNESHNVEMQNSSERPNPPERGERRAMPNGDMPKPPNGENAEEGDRNSNEEPRAFDAPFDKQMQRGGKEALQHKNAEENEEQKVFWGFLKNYSTPVISLVLLALAFVFVLRYKKDIY